MGVISDIAQAAQAAGSSVQAAGANAVKVCTEAGCRLYTEMANGVVQVCKLAADGTKQACELFSRVCDASGCSWIPAKAQQICDGAKCMAKICTEKGCKYFEKVCNAAGCTWKEVAPAAGAAAFAAMLAASGAAGVTPDVGLQAQAQNAQFSQSAAGLGSDAAGLYGANSACANGTCAAARGGVCNGPGCEAARAAGQSCENGTCAAANGGVCNSPECQARRAAEAQRLRAQGLDGAPQFDSLMIPKAIQTPTASVYGT